MAQLWILYKIQQIDNQMRLLLQEKAKLEDETEFAPQIAMLSRQTDSDSAMLETKCREMEEAESQSRRLLERKQELEAKLYTGEIVNSRELESREKEIARLNGELDENDARIFLLMENCEQLEERVEDGNSRLRSLAEQDRICMEEKTQQLQSLREKIASMEKEKKVLAEKFDDEALMKTFLNLQKQKQGIGIAKAAGGMCGGCFKHLPASSMERLGARELEFCKNCGRILFAERESR